MAKKLVDFASPEVDINEGLEGLTGKNVVLFAESYIYAGKLIEVSASYVKLANASIVYETGELVGKAWKDAQALPGLVWGIERGKLESWGESGR